MAVFNVNTKTRQSRPIYIYISRLYMVKDVYSLNHYTFQIIPLKLRLLRFISTVQTLHCKAGNNSAYLFHYETGAVNSSDIVYFYDQCPVSEARDAFLTSSQIAQSTNGITRT